MPFRPSPQGWAELHRRLTARALKGAEAGAEVLRDKLSQEGSGRHHGGQPNRSSAPGEYPALQTGDLRDSIAPQEVGDLHARFGPLANPPPEAVLMQVLPPDQGGRPYLDLAYADEDVRDAVLRGVKDEL